MTECVFIMGTAGRDFHDLNAAYRGRNDATVVTFTRAPGQNVAETAERSLERTIENAGPELVLAGAPHVLENVIDVNIPIVRVRYRAEPKGFIVIT
ncbi:MAG: hypothetical protein V5A56_14235, partial [Halolamina sp.]